MASGQSPSGVVYGKWTVTFRSRVWQVDSHLPESCMASGQSPSGVVYGKWTVTFRSRVWQADSHLPESCMASGQSPSGVVYGKWTVTFWSHVWQVDSPKSTSVMIGKSDRRLDVPHIPHSTTWRVCHLTDLTTLIRRGQFSQLSRQVSWLILHTDRNTQLTA